MTTGKSRPSQSLSGGESFLVSMALALGLSDVVQNHAGGKQLDALFIDEGFGFLDSDMLDRALLVLNRLTEGKLFGRNYFPCGQIGGEHSPADTG